MMSTWFGVHYCSRIPGDTQLQKTKGQMPENEENILRQMFLCNQDINFMVHLGAICTVLFNHFCEILTSVFQIYIGTCLTLLKNVVFFFVDYLPEHGRLMPKHVGDLLYDCVLLYQPNCSEAFGINSVNIRVSYVTYPIHKWPPLFLLIGHIKPVKIS
jgi:hypothetical protein